MAYLVIRRCLVLGLGAFLLAETFSLPYTDLWFYVLSVCLGVTWLVGWLVEIRPMETGRAGIRSWWAFLTGAVVGLVLTVVCAVGALVLSGVPVIGESISSVMEQVHPEVFIPVLITAVLVGVGEELYFRGAVVLWFPRYRLVASTGLYVLVTFATGKLALVVVAVLLGAATAYLRARTNTLVAPIACHVVWSIVLVSVLPGLLYWWAR